MQRITSIVDFAYEGTMGGKLYKGTAQSTEYWAVPDGPVDKGSLLEMHKTMWIDRMERENKVTVKPKSIRILNTQFLI